LNIAGNAKITSSDSSGYMEFKCQHGEDECADNMVEICMMETAPDQLTALQRVVCMFDNMKTHYFDESFKTCYPGDTEAAALQFLTCEMQKSKPLFAQAIKATPEHDSIPWAVVDEINLTSDDRDLINNDVFQWACNNYKGEKPTACSNNMKAFSLVEN